jgi:hypothetical protein
MARRVAPNIVNTLADPAEYELRLFYRGHEHIATPAADDARPKLDADDSRHGVPAADNDYRCVFWLDEHDHKAKADGEVANHQAKVNEAVVAKATKTQKNDRVPPLKDAWDKAKNDHDGTATTLKDKKEANTKAESDHLAADGAVFQQGKWVERCQDDVDDIGNKPRPLNANDTLQLRIREQKLIEARKELEKKQKSLTDATKKHEETLAEYEDAVREEAAAKQLETEAKDEYDKAVAESAAADEASTKADQAAVDADPVNIRAAKTRSLHSNSAAACAAAERSTRDADQAKLDAKNADQLEKDATTAEGKATADEQDSDALQATYDKSNFFSKLGLKGKLKDAKKLAKESRDAATAARERATRAREAATTSKSTATASKNAEMNAVKRSGDEPEPLKINTEIVKASDNKKYRILITDNHAGKGDLDGGTADSMTDSKPAQYAANGWLRDVFPAIPLEAVVLKTSDKKQLTFGASDVRVVWEVIDPAENVDIVDLFKGAGNPANGSDVPKNWIRRMFADAGFRSPTANPDSINDNCPTTFGGVRPAAGGVTPAPSLLFKAPFATSAPVGLDAFATIAGAGVSPVAPGKDKDSKPVGLSRVFFRTPPIGGDNYRFRLSLVDADGNKVKFKNADGQTVEFIETGTFTVWRRVTIDLMVTFESVDQATIDWHLTRDSYLPAFTQLIGPIMKKVYDKAGWERVVKAYFAREGSIPAAQRNNAANYAQAEFNTHLIPPFPILLKTGNDPDPSETAATSVFDTLSSGDMTDQGEAKLELRWTYTEALAKEFLNDTYTATGRINPRTIGDDYSQLTELPGLAAFFAKQPMAWSNVLGQYINDREFQFVQVGDVTCTFAHELGHAVFLTHSFTEFGVTSGGIVWTNNSQDEFQFSEHCQDDAIICTMAYSNDYFGDDGQTVRATRPVRWRFCAACLLKLRFWDLEALRANAQFMQWIHAGLGAPGASTLTIMKGNLTAIPGNWAMDRDGEEEFQALAAAEPTANNTGASVRKLLTTYAAGQWTADRADLASIGANDGILTGNDVAGAAPPPADARRVTVTYTLPTLGGNARGSGRIKVNP